VKRLILLGLLVGQDRPAEEVLAIKVSRALTVAKGDLEDVVIVVRDGKIAKIGKDIPSGARVIETPKGSVAAPGFIDAHSHLASAFEVEESTESVTPEVRAVEAFASDHPDVRGALGSGVTLVALAPGNGNLVGGRVGLIRLNGRRLDQMILKDAAGMKLSVSGDALRPDREPTSRQGALAMLRKLLADPRSEVAKALIDRKEPALIHASQADDIIRVAELKEAFKLRAVLVHGDGASEAIDAIRNAGVPVAFGPLLASDRREKLEAPGKLAKAGVRVAFVTDSPVASEADLRVMAAMAVKHGLDRREALRALTLTPAELLGIADRVGSLEEGKDADLVITGGDPLSLASGVELVLVEGRIVHEKPKK
jgi:imidazolonepropionase-like amidohydrolase